MSRVFISYARRDGIPYAEEIEQRLALHKLNPWRDITDIAAGHPWNREIDDAIADSYAMIVITTEAACKSVGVTYEWTRALTLGNTKVIVIYFPDKRNHIPQQLNTLHQLEWGHMDFWVKLTETLQRFQAEDGLVEVRIPVEADSQLKRLALQAFNNTFSWDTNVHAINALIDMPNDAVARQILINGLNSRRYRTVEHILKKMNEYGFQDECSFQKLYEILTTPKAEDTKSETRQAALRELVAEILAQWGFIVVNELSESEKWTDHFTKKQLLLPMYKHDQAHFFKHYFSKLLQSYDIDDHNLAFEYGSKWILLGLYNGEVLLGGIGEFFVKHILPPIAEYVSGNNANMDIEQALKWKELFKVIKDHPIREIIDKQFTIPLNALISVK